MAIGRTPRDPGGSEGIQVVPAPLEIAILWKHSSDALRVPIRIPLKVTVEAEESHQPAHLSKTTVPSEAVVGYILQSCFDERAGANDLYSFPIFLAVVGTVLCALDRPPDRRHPSSRKLPPSELIKVLEHDCQNPAPDVFCGSTRNERIKQPQLGLPDSLPHLIAMNSEELLKERKPSRASIRARPLIPNLASY